MSTNVQVTELPEPIAGSRNLLEHSALYISRLTMNMISVIRSVRIIKGSVIIPRELRLKYKMYEYTSIVFIEMEDGIMIKLLTGDVSAEETTRKYIAHSSPSVDTEINTVITELLRVTSS